MLRHESSAASAGQSWFRCPDCGSENLPGDKFCGECGHSLAVITEPIPHTISFEENLEKALEVYKECGADGWVVKTEETLAKI